jgi:hypothetical protein
MGRLNVYYEWVVDEKWQTCQEMLYLPNPIRHVLQAAQVDEREWWPSNGWSELPKNQTLVLVHIVQPTPLRLTSAEIAGMTIERFAPLYTVGAHSRGHLRFDSIVGAEKA